MALTLKELFNISNGLPLDTTVTITNKIEICLKRIAGKIVKGEIVYTGLPLYSTFPVTASQIKEWCSSVLGNSGTVLRMIPSICSDAAIELSGLDATDVEIDGACQWNICPFAFKFCN